MKIRVKKATPDVRTPTYGTEGAACFDLYAHSVVDGLCEITDDGTWLCEVSYGAPVVFDTGLTFEVPDSHALVVYSRSGHGFKHSVRLANVVGVCDADYRGTVKVRLCADSDINADPLIVKEGDRIAQAMIVPVERIVFEEAVSLSDTRRGAAGFGSTGN